MSTNFFKPDTWFGYIKKAETSGFRIKFIGTNICTRKEEKELDW